MAISRPTYDNRIMQSDESNWLWRKRYTGTTSGKRVGVLDIGVPVGGRDATNGTVEVWWELGTTPKSGTDYSHWDLLYRVGYSVGNDVLAYPSSNNTDYAICSVDYTGNFFRYNQTASSGHKYDVCRVAYSGRFTLKCDDSGKFTMLIYGAMKIYDHSLIQIPQQTITLGDADHVLDIPQVYVYNGSTWKNGTAYVYDGTNWVPGLMKAYDGTSWKP